MRTIANLFVLFLVCSLNSCDNKKATITSQKMDANDPFRKTIAESNFFEIDGTIDNVVTAAKGTILVLPKGCFKDANGDVYAGPVKIELAEALSLADMVLSNLTTTSNGALLETGGMIFFNATANGKQLTVNKDNPVHFEIPTAHKMPGMMAYKGTRDSLGNMNWIDPKPIEYYLLPIDLAQLNFRPEGFEPNVDMGLPFRNHANGSEPLYDSLYYSLSVSNGSELIKDLDRRLKMNEPFYNPDKEVIDGKYSDDSYRQTRQITDTAPSLHDNATLCGINPAMIKVLKSKAYEGTLIATREFETRLKIIHKTCNAELLQLYVKNMDRNLYEIDSMAEAMVYSSPYSHAFHNFYLERLTNVRNADKYSELLKDYFDKELQKYRNELQSVREKAVDALKTKNAEVKKVVEEYKEILFKREKFRMETYGFNWTDVGWINVDTGTIPKDWGPQPLTVKVEEATRFDRVYTYVIYESIQSLYRLNTDDNENFYVGNDQEKIMLMPKRKAALAITIAYKGETSFLSTKEFTTGVDQQLSVSPYAASIDSIRSVLRKYDQYAPENQIEIDLQYMQKFFEEEKRQKVLMKESEYIQRLWMFINSCCFARSDTTAITEK